MAEEKEVTWIQIEDFKDIKEKSDKNAMSPFTITIAGGAGSGKSTLALSMSDVLPVYVIDTELRLQYLVNKMDVTSGKPIKIVNVLGWEKMKQAVGALYRAFYGKGDSVHGVVVIDSGTDYKNYATAEWNEEGPTFPPTNYGRLYKMMDQPIAMLKSVGLAVVVTVRMKPVYINDKATDEMRPDFFKNQRYISDAVLVIDNEGKMSVDENAWADITKKDDTPISRDDRLPKIIRKLMGEKE